MPAGFLLNGLNDLIGSSRRRKKTRKGAESLEALLERALGNTGPSPSPQQQQELQRQLDPMLQMLSGGQQQPNPQQSPIPTGQPDQGLQDIAARSRAIQEAKGGTSGLDNYLSQTDPMYAAQLKAQQQGNQAAAYDFDRAQQLAMQDDAEADAWQQVLANPSLSKPERNILRASGREAGSAELLETITKDSAAPFEGTGIENQMLNKWIDNKDNPEWLQSTEGQLVRQRLGRDVTTVTPQGTFIRPGYDLQGLTQSGVSSPPPEGAEATGVGEQNPDGTFVTKPASERERTDLYVASNMFNRGRELSNVIANNPNFNPASAANHAGQVPGVGNYLVSPEYQQFRTGADEWASNLVFLRSGATARQEEKDSAFRNFFPQPGDADETIRLKNERRISAELDAYKKAMGSGRVKDPIAMQHVAALEQQLQQARGAGRSDEDILKQYGAN